jgi:hypothetical protein
MVSLCLLWEWPEMAALVLAGFTMSLRPGEILHAKRCDLSLPCDRLEPEGDAFLSIAVPESCRSYPIQYARCSDRATVKIMDIVFRHVGPTDPLMTTTSGQSGFRTRWNHLLVGLGVPLAKMPAGFDITPVGLQGTGATDFNAATEHLPRVFWRGRWRQASTAEGYLQDAAASTVLAALPEASRSLVEYFASVSDCLVASFLNAGLAGWPIQLAAARRTLVTSQGL